MPRGNRWGATMLAMGSLLVGAMGSMYASEFTGVFHRDDGKRFLVSRGAIFCASLGAIAGISLMVKGAVSILGFRTRRLRKVTNPRPRKLLVVLLSNLRLDRDPIERMAEHCEKPLPDDAEWTRNAILLAAPSLPEGLSRRLEFRDLSDDLAVLAEAKRRFNKPRWSWEQPLRAIHHGLRDDSRLKRLVIVCSRESVSQVGLFVLLVRRYRLDLQIELLLRQQGDEPLLQAFDRCANPYRLRPEFGWDFDDFDLLFQGFHGMLARLTRTSMEAMQVTDNDICIDWTGGTKPASVVAALVTVDRPIVNQYVTTEPKDPDADEWSYEILGYDITHK